MLFRSDRDQVVLLRDPVHHVHEQVAIAQIQTNTAEAQSGDKFASRWRPFIGWTCGMAFCWNYIGLSVARFVMTASGHPVELSPADMSEMMPVLLGMLGLGGLRTYEKVNSKN